MIILEADAMRIAEGSATLKIVHDWSIEIFRGAPDQVGVNARRALKMDRVLQPFEVTLNCSS